VGGEKAVGHFVNVYVGSTWYEGEVVAFNPVTDKHRISVMTAVDCGMETAIMLANAPSTTISAISPAYSPADYGAPTPAVVKGVVAGGPSVAGAHIETMPVEADLPDIDVALRYTVHTWTDLAHRQHIISGGGHGGTAAGSPLSYSSADVGQFVRVYWPNYSRDYYGRVLSYDPAQGLHTIAYEDKDVRAVCMTEKDYSVIDNIPDSIMGNIVGRSHGTAALIVANWHKNSGSVSAPPPPSASGVTTSVPGQTSPDSDEAKGVYIRPEPRAFHGFSYHLADVVDRWLASGGADFTLKIWDLNTGTCRCVCR
jgi:hypothetical protein